MHRISSCSDAAKGNNNAANFVANARLPRNVNRIANDDDNDADDDERDRISSQLTPLVGLCNQIGFLWNVRIDWCCEQKKKKISVHFGVTRVRIVDTIWNATSLRQRNRLIRSLLCCRAIRFFKINAVPDDDANLRAESFDESFVIDVNVTRLVQEVRTNAIAQC